MKLDNKMAKLICDLEYCIGSECFNPRSYDGWTGIEGLEYRYPVSIRINANDDEPTKVYGNVGRYYPAVNAESVETMKYIFGTNHLFIGIGIKHLLEELENRYDIDFNELEKKRKKR